MNPVIQNKFLNSHDMGFSCGIIIREWNMLILYWLI